MIGALFNVEGVGLRHFETLSHSPTNDQYKTTHMRGAIPCQAHVLIRRECCGPNLLTSCIVLCTTNTQSALASSWSGEAAAMVMIAARRLYLRVKNDILGTVEGMKHMNDPTWRARLSTSDSLSSPLFRYPNALFASMHRESPHLTP